MLVWWLVWLVGWLAGLVGWFVGWLVGPGLFEPIYARQCLVAVAFLVFGPSAWHVVRVLGCCLFWCLVGWLVGWFVGLLVIFYMQINAFNAFNASEGVAQVFAWFVYRLVG